MIDYSLILTINYKGKIWSLNGYEYEGLEWYDNNPKPTKEELDSQWEEVLSIIKKEQCKQKAQILLNESDWSDLYSIRNKLENINEWDSYRELIRELRINPIENPIFPDKPQTIWKEIIPIPIEEPIQEEIVNPIEEHIVNEESTI
jgi:hypothetical protein